MALRIQESLQHACKRGSIVEARWDDEPGIVAASIGVDAMVESVINTLLDGHHGDWETHRSYMTYGRGATLEVISKLDLEL